MERDHRVSDSSTSRDTARSKKAQLAFAVATGASVAAWADSNDVPTKTAYRWARQPAVCRRIDHIRRRIINRAIGRMTRRFAWATDQIARLAATPGTRSAQLNALRAIFYDTMKLGMYFEVRSALSELGERVNARRFAGADYAGQRTPYCTPHTTKPASQ
jgi:hypothetical protein